MPIAPKTVVPEKGPMAGQKITVNKYYYSSKDKPVAVIMGCFSPFTGIGGHGRQLITATKAGIEDFVLAIVPKKEKLDANRNMFTLEQKYEIAKKAITDLGYNLIDSFIAEKNFPASILKEVAERNPDRRIVLICGPDREEAYSKFCKPYDVNNEQEPGLEHDDYEYILNDPGPDDIRGTAVRAAIRDNDKDMFLQMTGYKDNMWKYLRNLAIKNGVISESLVTENSRNTELEDALADVDKIANYVYSVINPNTGEPNELYYVGGCVRDELMGKEPNDFDLLTTMDGKEFEAAPIWDKADHMFRPGKVVILGYLNGECYEVNTIFPDPTHPKGIIANLQTRDITVNAIAKNVKTNKIVDPLKGAADIKNKIIRATETTDTKFRAGKEPVRVIRILRFLGYFGDGWKLAPETKDALMEFSKVTKGKCKIPPNQFEVNWNKIKINKDKIIELIKELGFHDFFIKEYPCYAKDCGVTVEKTDYKTFTEYLNEHKLK